MAVNAQFISSPKLMNVQIQALYSGSILLTEDQEVSK